MKDVVKTGGEWVDSIQLEELIATVPSVVEASVIAVADDKWGERPLAVIISRPGTAPTLAEINAPIDRAIQSGVITRYARIDRFVVIESLPRTSVGKIDKKALRAQFSET
ncbi:MAG: hypothetical protein ABI395_08310 [Sphingobium sp.]